MKLLGLVNVDFDVICNSAFINYLRKKGNTVTQYIKLGFIKIKDILEKHNQFLIKRKTAH